MSETAKVRGAVLEENKGVDLDSISHKSDEEKIDNTIEKLSDIYQKNMNVSEKKMMEMSDGSESDVRSNISSSGRSERQRISRERAETNRTSLRNRDKNSNSDELVKNGQDFQNFAIHNAKNREKSEMEGFRRAQMIEDEVTGYTQAGPPNHVSRSNYAYENADFVGDDRAELLKKLDELTSQLNRSGNLVDKGKEKVPLDRRTAQPSPYGHSYVDSSFETNRPQFRRPYHNEYSEPPPLMHNGNGYYPPEYGATHVQGYNDRMRSHMLRRDHYDYQISNSRAYMHKDYIDDGSVYMDNMEPNPVSNFSRHHSSCPCYQCLNNRQIPPRVQPTGYSDNDKMFDYRVNSGSSFGSRDYTQRNPDPHPLRSRNAQSHLRWNSDVDSEVDAVIRRRTGRMHLSSNGQYCRPIAGGAPFLTCYNCFELLMLPKKGLTKNSNKKKKMRCGACSTVIVFVVSNKSLVISTAMDNVVVPPSQDKTTFSSNDYGNNASDEVKSRHRASTYTSEVDEERESLAGPAKHSGRADMATEDKRHPLPAGSSLQDYFEHSNKYHLAKRLGDENRSGLSENEKQLPMPMPLPLLDKITPRRKESSATEIDISSHEYYNTGTTLDSGEGSKEGSRGESFFRKVSFKDSQGSIDSFEHENANVTVNGHLIPHRSIKKAEKLAGPISPGNYWYDFRAGFWGVMGGPCLGIIPPFIGEFNYPMSDHCAGGNTRVYVNGRELNQKDLKLLGNRGLPTEGDRSYIVEISGRVLDGDTGEELQSLGKLAPTLERVKHGFGMRAPNSVALK